MRGRRLGSTFSLILGDFDDFKGINDHFGHARGDEALERFGSLVAGALRAIDGSARLGGEEFAFVVPGASPEGARGVAERLREMVRDEFAGFGEDGLTMSFGIAAFPRHGGTARDLLRRADLALYLAKRRGRDQSVVYTVDGAATHVAAAIPPAPGDQLPSVLALVETLDQRNPSTQEHSRTVGEYAEAIALRLGFGRRHVERVRLAGVLHDIGMLGVPEEVIRRAELTDAERSELRRHPGAGRADPRERQPRRSRPVGARPPRAAGRAGPTRRACAARRSPSKHGSSRRRCLRDVPQRGAGDGRGRGRRSAAAPLGTRFDAQVVEAFLASRAAAGEEPATAEHAAV